VIGLGSASTIGESMGLAIGNHLVENGRPLPGSKFYIPGSVLKVKFNNQNPVAYGMPGEDVDGNDVLAVHASMTKAVERARSGKGPSLVVLKTYRMLGHSSSDDPTKYRSDEEVKAWEQKDPLTRFRAYLEKKKLLDPSVDEQVDEEIARAVERFEAMPAADPLGMFDHAYAELPRDVAAQRAELAGRLEVQPDVAAPSGAEPASPPMRGQRRTTRWTA
jgi:hypothetical protein